MLASALNSATTEEKPSPEVEVILFKVSNLGLFKLIIALPQEYPTPKPEIKIFELFLFF